jgi:hypothetical protein
MLYGEVIAVLKTMLPMTTLDYTQRKVFKFLTLNLVLFKGLSILFVGPALLWCLQ